MATPNYMKTVFCTAKGVRAPANSTAKGDLRCTLCGNTHAEAKKFEAVDLTPAKVGKKHFKKGGKSKGKKKADPKAKAVKS